jgi:hypothetical protein
VNVHVGATVLAHGHSIGRPRLGTVKNAITFRDYFVNRAWSSLGSENHYPVPPDVIADGLSLARGEVSLEIALGRSRSRYAGVAAGF